MRLYKEGAYQEALPLFDEVLRRRSRDVESRTKRGNIYLCIDQPERALADFNEVIRLTPPMAVTSLYSAISSPSMDSSPMYPAGA